MREQKEATKEKRKGKREGKREREGKRQEMAGQSWEGQVCSDLLGLTPRGWSSICVLQKMTPQRKRGAA